MFLEKWIKGLLFSKLSEITATLMQVILQITVHLPLRDKHRGVCHGGMHPSRNQNITITFTPLFFINIA